MNDASLCSLFPDQEGFENPDPTDQALQTQLGRVACDPKLRRLNLNQARRVSAEEDSLASSA